MGLKAFVLHMTFLNIQLLLFYQLPNLQILGLDPKVCYFITSITLYY